MKAQDYKKLARNREKIEELTLPSGAVFRVRAAPIAQWSTVGILPASLAAKMQAAAKATDIEGVAKQILATFTEKDFMQQQELGRKLLEYCCIEPKVAVNSEAADTISPEDILPEDFQFLMQWLWSGGKEAQGLETFRNE